MHYENNFWIKDVPATWPGAAGLLAAILIGMMLLGYLFVVFKPRWYTVTWISVVLWFVLYWQLMRVCDYIGGPGLFLVRELLAGRVRPPG